MSVKKALLYGFAIVIILVLSTWYIGHLWVFIILVVTAFIGIAVSTIRKNKKKGNKSSNDDQR